MAAHSNLTDQELMVLLKEGDNSAFSEIYERYWKVLLNTAYQRLRSTQASEEVVQDIFVSFFVRRAEIELKSNLEAYFKSALKYRVFNLFRSRKVLVSDVVLDEAGFYGGGAPSRPDELMEATDLRNKIYEVAGRMPDKCRQVFLLSRFDQLSQKEIAERLDISVSTVQKHITRATGILRSEFKSHQMDFVAICFFIYFNK